MPKRRGNGPTFVHFEDGCKCLLGVVEGAVAVVENADADTKAASAEMPRHWPNWLATRRGIRDVHPRRAWARVRNRRCRCRGTHDDLHSIGIIVIVIVCGDGAGYSLPVVIIVIAVVVALAARRPRHCRCLSWYYSKPCRRLSINYQVKQAPTRSWVLYCGKVAMAILDIYILDI